MAAYRTRKPTAKKKSTSSRQRRTTSTESEEVTGRKLTPKKRTATKKKTTSKKRTSLRTTRATQLVTRGRPSSAKKKRASSRTTPRTSSKKRASSRTTPQAARKKRASSRTTLQTARKKKRASSRTTRATTLRKKRASSRATSKTARIKKRASSRTTTTRATKPKPKLTRAQKIRAEKRRLDRRVAALKKRQRATRRIPAKTPGTGRPSPNPIKAKIREEQRKIGKSRATKAIEIEKLPRATPTQKRRSKRQETTRAADNARRLMEIARELDAEERQLGREPILPSRSIRVPRVINSQRQLGRRRRVWIGRWIDESNVEDILYTIDQVGSTMPRGDFAVWTSILVVSACGEDLVGSSPVLLKHHDPDARYFQTEGYLTTGDFNSYLGMLAQIRVELEQIAARIRTVVYLHYVEIRNFDRRS